MTFSEVAIYDDTALTHVSFDSTAGKTDYYKQFDQPILLQKGYPNEFAIYVDNETTNPSTYQVKAYVLEYPWENVT